MTHYEMSKLVDRLNELQAQFYKLDRHFDKIRIRILRGEWDLICTSLKMAGYGLAKEIIRDENGKKVKVKWIGIDPNVRKTRKYNMHSEYFKYTDVRPKGVKCLKGDCTTRCITFCVGGDYVQIRNYQKAVGLRNGLHFNDSEIWDIYLRDHGWKRIYLTRKMYRRDVARLTASLPHPLATSSSGHVAATFGGKVIDTWESQNGKVNYVVCRVEDEQMVRSLLPRAW